MSDAMRFDEDKYITAVENALDPEKPGSKHPMPPARLIKDREAKAAVKQEQASADPYKISEFGMNKDLSAMDDFVVVSAEEKRAKMSHVKTLAAVNQGKYLE